MHPEEGSPQYERSKEAGEEGTDVFLRYVYREQTDQSKGGNGNLPSMRRDNLPDHHSGGGSASLPTPFVESARISTPSQI